MLLMILNVVYVLLAIAMIAMILMQRGAGAQAGSGFGAGASATVFGSRGAGNFLSKSTKWLAILFFGISLFMAWYATNSATKPAEAQQNSVMDELPKAPAAPPATGNAVPTAPAAQAPATTVPTAPATAPATDATVPAAPAATQPQQPAPQPSQGG